MVFIHRHISNLRLDLSICRHYSALVSADVVCAYSALMSTEALCAAPSELSISRHPACAVGTPQGLTVTFLPPEKSHTKCFCRHLALDSWAGLVDWTGGLMHLHTHCLAKGTHLPCNRVPL